MYKKIQNIIDHLAGKPKTLFLIDSLGAMLTAFALCVVLIPFNKYFGIPITVLTYLSAIAAYFCIYSTICFFFLKENWSPFIKAISIANVLYCILTIGVVIVHYSILTPIGITYFLVETILICGLVYIERNVAAKISTSATNN